MHTVVVLCERPTVAHCASDSEYHDLFAFESPLNLGLHWQYAVAFQKLALKYWPGNGGVTTPATSEPTAATSRGAAKVFYQHWLDYPAELSTTFNCGEGLGMCEWWSSGFNAEGEAADWIECGLQTFAVKLTSMITSTAGAT